MILHHANTSSSSGAAVEPWIDLTFQTLPPVPQSASRNHPNAVALSEITKFARESPPARTTFSALLAQLFKAEFQEAAKSLLHLIARDRTLVKGTGIVVTGLENLSSAEKDQLRISALSEPQSFLDWSAKLKIASVISACGVAGANLEKSKESEYPTREEIVKYLANSVRPGDLIFLGQGGSAEPFGSELFEAHFRWRGAKIKQDERGPFMHVGLVLEDGNVMHITTKGTRIHSLEQLLVKTKRFESVAIGELGIAPESIPEFLRSAKEFGENRKYNHLWASNIFGWSRRVFGSNVDRSATKTSGVCPDLITEALRSLQSLGGKVPSSLLSSVLPMDLFSDSNVKIKEAIDL